MYHFLFVPTLAKVRIIKYVSKTSSGIVSNHTSTLSVSTLAYAMAFTINGYATITSYPRSHNNLYGYWSVYLDSVTIFMVFSYPIFLECLQVYIYINFAFFGKFSSCF